MFFTFFQKVLREISVGDQYIHNIQRTDMKTAFQAEFAGIHQYDQTVIAFCLTLCAQICQCGKGHGQMGIDQFLPARDLRQVQGGVCCGIQTADMGYHNRRIDASCRRQLQGFYHIVGITAGGAGDMGGVVMY